jgi:hypothetical protein
MPWFIPLYTSVLFEFNARISQDQISGLLNLKKIQNNTNWEIIMEQYVGEHNYLQLPPNRD